MPKGKHFDHHFDVAGGRAYFNVRRVGDRKVHVELLFAYPGVPATLQFQGVLEGGVVVHDKTGKIAQMATAVGQVRAAAQAAGQAVDGLSKLFDALTQAPKGGKTHG